MAKNTLDKEESILITYIKEALSGAIYLKDDPTLTYKGMIGFGLSYYLTSLLRKLKDSNIKGKWVDGVEWESFDLIPPNKLNGGGKLWWGFRKDNSSKTFPEDFYCELEVLSRGKSSHISYLFQFKIDGKLYDLNNKQDHYLEM